MEIFGFYDKVAQRMRGVTISENKGLVIRENAKALSEVYPLADIEIRRLGVLDEESGNIKEVFESRDKTNIVNWNEYEFPESPFKKVDKTKNEKKN